MLTDFLNNLFAYFIIFLFGLSGFVCLYYHNDFRTPCALKEIADQCTKNQKADE